MKATRIAAALVLVGSLVLPTGLRAQNEVSSTVDEFDGLPWGSSIEAIVDTNGAPALTDTLENDIIVLAYRDTVLDLPATTLYAVVPERGLVKGQHMVDLDLEAGDCEGQYRRLQDHIKLSYPLITPVESIGYPFDQDLCSAVRDGAGEWSTQWTDRSTNSIITVIVERGSDEVKLIFESGLFLDWLGVSPPEEDPGS